MWDQPEPHNFVFGKKEVEFIGFQIWEDSFASCAVTVEAIRQFRRPHNITGVRTWFGRVELVSFAFSKNKKMDPFRDLLTDWSKSGVGLVLVLKSCKSLSSMLFGLMQPPLHWP